MTEEISSLKTKKPELEAEMAALIKKSKRAEKYKKKGSSSRSTTASTSVATPPEEFKAMPHHCPVALTKTPLKSLRVLF